MSSASESQGRPYSWHQSHDQATVLFLAPYHTREEDLQVVIERNHLVAGVRGQPPVVKGRLYGGVNTTASVWQLEPTSSRLSLRERTTSTTSTTSTRSSYALVSEPDISSGFTTSLDSTPTSDTEELGSTSPALSSPVSSADERAGFAMFHRRRKRHAASRATSPRDVTFSIASSLSSVESLHSSRTGRLLTIHLEKADSIIWPSLIVGPVPEALSPSPLGPSGLSASAEQMFNMDPTSLALLALDLFDIRHDAEKAYEYFLRAWLQAHLPSAAIRLVTHYVPLHIPFSPSITPEQEQPPRPGTPAYYVHGLGGSAGLAQLYLEAGLLHLEGAASVLLSSSYSPLSSIRLPSQPQPADVLESGGTEAWKRDREAARRYFERARVLHPSLEIPLLPPEGQEPAEDDTPAISLQMPSVDVQTDADAETTPSLSRRRQRPREEPDHELLEKPETKTAAESVDNTWYLAIPGLVGAGTALLVVGVVGVLSISSWRKSQN
ncbi:hypothetical protein FA95DRAFT_1588054 [Auriscalpium vulgare]|uniref:Uncharacterized protein n=1 Tax=Auriscalpium vulgare TaxID=40419 RepID=A0ACB8S014_9AGAM|nr:hypothetical protein FA95DRAFT_1588054 [Auriscalpium vulgare]